MCCEIGSHFTLWLMNDSFSNLIFGHKWTYFFSIAIFCESLKGEITKNNVSKSNIKFANIYAIINAWVQMGLQNIDY